MLKETVTENKAIDFDTARENAIEIFTTLINEDQQFTFQHRRILRKIIFTSVQDCDSVKHFVPQFELRRDSRQERYVEVVIEYYD